MAILSTTITDRSLEFARGSGRNCRVIEYVWESSAGGAVSDSVDFPGGYCMNVITAPGTPTPTDQYDFTLLHGEIGSGLDVLNGKLVDRSDTNTESVQPVVDDGATPVFIAPGSYTFTIANAGATTQGTVRFELLDS